MQWYVSHRVVFTVGMQVTLHVQSSNFNMYSELLQRRIDKLSPRDYEDLLFEKYCTIRVKRKLVIFASRNERSFKDIEIKT